MDTWDLFSGQLSRIPDIRSACTNPDEFPFRHIVFVPTEFESWSGGGLGFDPNYTDRHDKTGRPVSVCSQFLSLLMGREDKPEWFDRPRLEFIDLRHGSDTLYFFRASRQMAEDAIQNTQAHSSEVFKLAGQSLPPELFELMQRNLNLNDVGLVRQTAAAVADLPINNKQLCNNINIDFNLNDDSTAADDLKFEAHALSKIENLSRECERVNETIKKVSINLVDEGDADHFIDYANESEAMARILASVEEIFVPGLSVGTPRKARSVFGSLSSLFKTYPRLHVFIGILFLSVRPIATSKYRGRLHIQKLTHTQDITAEDVLALTSHPVQSMVLVGQNQNQESDDEE